MADSHRLQIDIRGIPPIPTFAFSHKESPALHTLFTQEMLKRGFLASKAVYVSYSHKEEHLKRYLENVDEVFKIIEKAIKEDNVRHLLRGAVAHTGFRRLA